MSPVEHKMQASFSILVMSIASSAALALGISPHPDSGEIKTDKEMARFNIDLLLILKDKTKSNLSDEETRLVDSILSDLQMKFLQL